MYKFAILLFCLNFLGISLRAQKTDFFTTHTVMKDLNGNAINAHGGGILFFNGTYYWYGEVKKGKTWAVKNSNWENYRVEAGGISCYSSKDLTNWKFEGIVLPAENIDSTHDLHFTKVIERPKVIFNKKTKQFVMWMHIDSEDYASARSGVATSNKPTGPFTYLGSERPNGNMARDMTLFVDDDGKAYHFYSSEDNATMHINLLTEDYLKHTAVDKKILINEKREAPAVFKYQGRYYLISSGCTGWSPNAASYAVANNILGDWKMYGNPCVGPGYAFTYQAQSSYVLQIPGKPNQYIFIADRWNKKDLAKSQYLFLPLTMNAQFEPVIYWKDEWQLNDFVNGKLGK